MGALVPGSSDPAESRHSVPQQKQPDRSIILHDDGTYALYAHLNTNTIRVKPGDHVQRGQYIADSGNTGYSSGPHLHFAVIRNAGLRPESVPVTFQGPQEGSSITPTAGTLLTAY